MSGRAGRWRSSDPASRLQAPGSGLSTTGYEADQAPETGGEVLGPRRKPKAVSGEPNEALQPGARSQEPASDLARLRHYLFSPDEPASRQQSGDVIFFSAPGEGREAVEVARYVLDEARRGVRFDEMAVLLRSPREYLGLLEHAFARAGISASLRPRHPPAASRRPRAACAAVLRRREPVGQPVRRVPVPCSGAERGDERWLG